MERRRKLSRAEYEARKSKAGLFCRVWQLEVGDVIEVTELETWEHAYGRSSVRVAKKHTILAGDDLLTLKPGQQYADIAILGGPKYKEWCMDPLRHADYVQFSNRWLWKEAE